jgi:hypothetical protein
VSLNPGPTLRGAFKSRITQASILSLLVGGAIAAATLSTTGDLTVGGDVVVGGVGGPVVTKGTGVPAGLKPRGSVFLRTDSAKVYQATDAVGTWAQVGAVESSLAIAIEASPGAKNVSTEGNIDWCFVLNTADGTNTGPGASNRMKRYGGGFCQNSVKWAVAPGFAGATVTGPTTFTDTTADAMYTFSALNTATYQGYATGTADVGAGIVMTLPVTPTTQVLRVPTLHFNNTLTVDCKFNDGSATPVSTFETSNQDNGTGQFKVTYSGALGTWLICKFIITARTVGAPNPNSNIFFGYITIATS